MQKYDNLAELVDWWTANAVSMLGLVSLSNSLVKSKQLPHELVLDQRLAVKLCRLQGRELSKFLPGCQLPDTPDYVNVMQATKVAYCRVP